MQLVISIDVEEEGLFSGVYARTPPGVSNVQELRRLEFIPREFGFPLTLLVTHWAARDAAARQVLLNWRQRRGSEIGLHLHPWNTPPFADVALPEPISSEDLPQDILRAKLATLAASVRDSLGVQPVSFRMGRFDRGPKLMALLPEIGVKVDSSVVPLGGKGQVPGDFLAPADPYFLGEGPGRLLEAPLTMASICPGLAPLVHRLAGPRPQGVKAALRRAFRYLGVAGIQPAWFPLASMQLAAALHRRRGGRVLVMFFHSSELQPGATRLFPTEAAVQGLVGKIRRFLQWLTVRGPVTGVTLGELYRGEGA
jgi:hypothetical protein